MVDTTTMFWVVGTGLAGIVAFILYNKFANFPVLAIVVEKRAGMPIINIMVAQRVKEKGGKEYYSLKNKGMDKNVIKIKPQDLGNLYNTPKGKNVLFLYKVDNNHYTPLRLELFGEDEKAGAKVNAIESDLLLWDNVMAREDRMRFSEKTFYEKYGFMIMVLVVGVSISLIFYSSTFQLEAISAQIGSLNSAISGLKGAVSNVPLTSPV